MVRFYSFAHTALRTVMERFPDAFGNRESLARCYVRLLASA